MGIKYVISALEEVPEAYRSLYVKREDGKFVLDAEGAADKTKLNEFRENNVELLKKLESLKDIDPKKYAELLDLDRQKREKQLIESGKVDEVIAERIKLMKEEHDKTLATKDNELKVANRQLETLLIDNTVKSAAVAHGVLPTAIDDIVLRAKTAFSIQNGSPVMKDDKGQVVYGQDGTTPLSIGDWTKQLKTTAPHLFAGFNGSGASGGRGGHQPGTGNMSAVDKISAGLSAGLGSNKG